MAGTDVGPTNAIFCSDVLEAVLQAPRQCMDLFTFVCTKSGGANTSCINGEDSEQTQKSSRSKLANMSNEEISAQSSLLFKLGSTLGLTLLLIIEELHNYLQFHRIHTSNRLVIMCYEAAFSCMGVDLSSIPLLATDKSELVSAASPVKASSSRHTAASPTSGSDAVADAPSPQALQQQPLLSDSFQYKLRMKAGEVLMNIFCIYKGHRNSIMHEMLPLFVLAYENKVGIKSFADCAQILSGTSSKHSTAFIVLLNLLQSTLVLDMKAAALDEATSNATKADALVKRSVAECRQFCNYILTELFKVRLLLIFCKFFS